MESPSEETRCLRVRAQIYGCGDAELGVERAPTGAQAGSLMAHCSLLMHFCEHALLHKVPFVRFSDNNTFMVPSSAGVKVAAAHFIPPSHVYARLLGSSPGTVALNGDGCSGRASPLHLPSQGR